MLAKAHNTLYERERIWFFSALACLLVSVILYMYFLSASVFHVVMRKEIDKEITASNSTLSALETEYIESQHEVSEEIASLRGYTRTEKKVFIDRTDTTLSLSN